MPQLDKGSIPPTSIPSPSSIDTQSDSPKQTTVKAQTNQGKPLNQPSLRQRSITSNTAQSSALPELDLSDSQQFGKRLLRAITRLDLPRKVVMEGGHKDKAFYKDVIIQDAILSKLMTQYKNASSEEKTTLEYPLLSCAFAYQGILNRAYK